MSAQRVTATAGPNSSSQLMRMVGIDVGHQRGFVKRAVAVAAGHEFGAAGDRFVDPICDAPGVGFADHRSHLRVFRRADCRL